MGPREQRARLRREARVTDSVLPPATLNDPDASVSTDAFVLAARAPARTAPSVFRVTVPAHVLSRPGS